MGVSRVSRNPALVHAARGAAAGYYSTLPPAGAIGAAGGARGGRVSALAASRAATASSVPAVKEMTYDL